MGGLIGKYTWPFILLFSLSACAPATMASFDATELESRAGTVEVQNDGSRDVTMYLSVNGMEYRLGKVARMERRRFQIPQRMQAARGDQMHLVARYAGVGHVRQSPAIRWSPGNSLFARLGRLITNDTFDLWMR